MSMFEIRVHAAPWILILFLAIEMMIQAHATPVQKATLTCLPWRLQQDLNVS